MPDVTVDPNEYERYDLKTAPPDGFVMLRPLPFGKKLTRRDKATKLQMRVQGDGRGRGNQNDQSTISLDTLNEWATAYDFTYCVGDHNLTDKNGVKLDFNNPRSINMVLGMLNPKVGSEIERLISDLNEEEEEEAVEDFSLPAGGSSDGQTTSVMDSPETETSTEQNVSPIT